MDNEILDLVLGPSWTKMVDKEVEESAARKNNATAFLEVRQ